MTGPLTGLTVIEVGEGITAAYSTLLLASLGATVIKVEPPGGDETRRIGPFPDDLPQRELSALFLDLNRNKESIVLDLTSATGQDLFRQLARAADVVVENCRPGALDELGIGYDVLSAEHPQLVVTSITPFGQSGPYRDYAADEITLFGMGGLMSLMGDIEREPLKFAGQPGLRLAGVYGFTATLTAVHLAEETGLGQHVDVSVLEGLAASHFQDLTEYEYTGNVRRRGELRLPIPTLDGFISFSVQAHQYGDFRSLILGEAPSKGDDDDAVARDRQRLEGELDQQILMWSVQRSKYDAYREAQEAHVPAAFLADMADLLDAPQYAARDYWVTIDAPRTGPLRYPGVAAKLTGMEVDQVIAPQLGEHTDQIIAKYTDLTEAEIIEIRSAGVLG